MVRARAVRVALGAAVFGPIACHVIAGVEDKELDPKYVSGGSGGSTADAPFESETGGTGAENARPPLRPAGWRGPSGKGVRRWFAARRVFIGSVDPKSPPGAPVKDDTAWRRIGHDLDGTCTTVAQSISDTSQSCKKPGGAPDESLEDGELCRDNAAGRLVAFGLQVLSNDFEISVHNKLISADSATFILELSDLDDAPDDPYVPGQLYVSVATGVHPLWNGSDEFSIDAATVDLGGEAGSADAAPPDAGSDAEAGASSLPPSLYRFPDGYLRDNVWVSADFNQTQTKLPLFVFDRITPLDVAAMNLEVTLDAAHDAALDSTLSAVASKTTMETQFQPIAYEMVDCNSLLAAALMGQYVLPAMDVANLPPDFSSTSAKCEAMSFGFGFDWVPIKQPVSVIPAPPVPPKCDAG